MVIQQAETTGHLTQDLSVSSTLLPFLLYNNHVHWRVRQRQHDDTKLPWIEKQNIYSFSISVANILWIEIGEMISVGRTTIFRFIVHTGWFRAGCRHW